MENSIIKLNDAQVVEKMVDNFNIEGKAIEELSKNLSLLMNTTERLIIDKREKESIKLERILNMYSIPLKEYMDFIKSNVYDEYLPKFKEMELEGWYKMYDYIEKSELSDETKINHQKDVMEKVAKNNREKDISGLAKLAVGAFALIKGISTIGSLINESGDSQATRRYKAKMKSKK